MPNHYKFNEFWSTLKTSAIREKKHREKTETKRNSKKKFNSGVGATMQREPYVFPFRLVHIQSRGQKMRIYSYAQLHNTRYL